MSFWVCIQELCNERKTKPSVVVKDLGLSTSMPTLWKQGRIPNGTTLQKIADYFNVSVDYLLGKESSPNNSVFLSYHHDSDAAAAQLARPLSERELELWTKIKTLDESETAELDNYLNYLMSKRKAKDVPGQPL